MYYLNKIKCVIPITFFGGYVAKVFYFKKDMDPIQ